MAIDPTFVRTGDTGISDEDLKQDLGHRVAKIVRLVTKPEETSPAEEAEIDRGYLQPIRAAKDPGLRWSSWRAAWITSAV